MPELPYRLDRTVVIRAKPGGKVYIRHPNGIESLGEVLEVDHPERIAFTYGFVGGKPIPPGSSRVTIRLEPDDVGTRLHLRHEFPDAATRDEHVQGWRFQLSLFSNVVANEVYAHAANAVDAWFGAWTIADNHHARKRSPGSSLRKFASATASVCSTGSLT